ncbi:MAG: hypothetical protein V3T72_03960 [Thermoanaerobaculia bacterium]
MTRIEEIETAVAALSPNDLAQFRDWFAEFEAAAWDEQFERDVRTGKLDKLADEALASRAGGGALS